MRELFKNQSYHNPLPLTHPRRYQLAPTLILTVQPWQIAKFLSTYSLTLFQLQPSMSKYDVFSETLQTLFCEIHLKATH